jgi:hypothetical protein
LIHHTSGTEANLLKFKEILNKLTPEEANRWNEIKEAFVANNRVKSMGGDATAALMGEVVRIQGQMANISGTLKEGVGKMNNRPVNAAAPVSFSSLWEASNEIYDWDKLRLELSEWIEDEEVLQRLRLFTRHVKPLLKSVEPMYQQLQNIHEESLPEQDKEEIGELKKSINRLLFTYGSFIKVLMAVKK